MGRQRQQLKVMAERAANRPAPTPPLLPVIDTTPYEKRKPSEPLSRIIVTPAGRRQYLEILYGHLKAQKIDFDEWWLLVNTSVPDDVAYCEQLADKSFA